MPSKAYQTYEEAAQDYVAQFNALLEIPEEVPGTAKRGAGSVPVEPLIERAEAIGLAALIAGPGGLGWQRRLALIAQMLSVEPVPEQSRRVAERYGFSAAALAGSMERFVAICRTLDERLASQLESGSSFFVGESVSAADFYWACFLGMLKPLPREVNPMPDWAWGIYEAKEPEVVAVLSDRLTAHRDMMYRDYISLPLDF